MTRDSASVRDEVEPELMPVELYLPTGWWLVDVRSKRARDHSIRTLVESRVGRADDHAKLRAELRAELGRQAQDAMRAGAFLLAISLMEHDEIGLPAALAGYRVPRSGGGELRSLQAAIGPHESVELVEAERGDVLRTTSTSDARLDPNGPQVPMFRADYWLDLPGTSELVLLVFTTPLVEAAEAFLDLFDAIAATVAVSPHDHAPLRTPDDTKDLS